MAEIGGVTVQQMNALEIQLLKDLQWAAFIDAEDYSRFCQHLVSLTVALPSPSTRAEMTLAVAAQDKEKNVGSFHRTCDCWANHLMSKPHLFFDIFLDEYFQASRPANETEVETEFCSRKRRRNVVSQCTLPMCKT
jgi:hypothetical protein